MHNRSRLIIAILLVGPPASADTFYFGANIDYRRHDTRVIDVETVTLQLIVTL